MDNNKTLVELNIWTIYDTNTVDYPGLYVARLFVGDKPTGAVYADKDLVAVRNWIRRAKKFIDNDWNIYRVDRAPTDDPVILEIWI